MAAFTNAKSCSASEVEEQFGQRESGREYRWNSKSHRVFNLPPEVVPRFLQETHRSLTKLNTSLASLKLNFFEDVENYTFLESLLNEESGNQSCPIFRCYYGSHIGNSSFVITTRR